jgi:hypothetical protein
MSLMAPSMSVAFFCSGAMCMMDVMDLEDWVARRYSLANGLTRLIIGLVCVFLCSSHTLYDIYRFSMLGI